MSAALPLDPEPSFAELVAERPHLAYHAQDGLLVEDVPLAAIADTHGTPVWVLSAGSLRARLAQLQRAMQPVGVAIHYAVKANDHLAVLAVMRQGGAGADVVSGGELHRALAAGIDPARIVFSGVGKQDWEIRAALAAGIGQLNAESAEELATVSAIATTLGKTARIALRINPDIDAGTHAKITTGRAENKFGIPYHHAAALYAHAAGLPGLEPVGLALHIGSQILSLEPYHAAYRKTAELVRQLRAGGQRVDTVDCGGGLGIAYRDRAAPPPEALAAAIRQAFAGQELHLAIEPGRWLAGPAGLLLTRAILSKAEGRFLVLDAAMNDLVRPAMYDAWHAIVPVAAADAVAPTSPVEIVGPVCESGDTFARARLFPRLDRHSLVAILDAGAYGSVMSSSYNARPLAAQVMVDGARFSLIRPRQPLEALWADETIPDELR